MNKKELKQIQNFEKELLKGGLFVKGSKYYNKEGKEVPYPSVAVMKDIENKLRMKN